MPSEALQLYVLNKGKLDLTEDGKRVSGSKDYKYLESLLHQFSDQVSSSYRDKATRQALSDKYEETDQQLRASLGSRSANFELVTAQLIELGPHPESPGYKDLHSLGDDYLFPYQIDDLLRILNASRDLVNRRMREIGVQSESGVSQTRTAPNISQSRSIPALEATTAASRLSSYASQTAAKESRIISGQRFEKLRKSASSGDPQSQFELGQCYEKGCAELAPNSFYSKYWYELASKQGHVEAKASLERLKRLSHGHHNSPKQGHVEPKANITRIAHRTPGGNNRPKQVGEKLKIVNIWVEGNSTTKVQEWLDAHPNITVISMARCVWMINGTGYTDTAIIYREA